MATMTTNAAARAAVEGLVTVHQPIDLGSNGLFAVQPGVPVLRALDGLSTLLCTARETAFQAASVACGADSTGAAWAVEHLLTLACALAGSVSDALRQHQSAGGDA